MSRLAQSGPTGPHDSDETRPTEEDRIERSRAIQCRTGPTFYFATRFLPERVREPTHVLYAFFRIADEVVDDAAAIDRPEAAKRAAIEELRAQALGDEPPDDPVLAAFEDVRRRRDVPDREVDLFLDAMATDASKRRYADVAELREYVRGSAAAVGAMMTAIVDPEEPDRALPHAKALGEAFQLTNFLRDVREDVRDRDRIYLPERTLRRHGADHEQVARLEFDDDVAAAIEETLLRTEAWYRHGVAGIELLPPDCQFPVLLAAVLYADYHRSIRALDFDVLSTAPELTRRRTSSLYVRTRLRWQFSRDPATVFDAVSPISMDGRGERLLSGEPMTPPTP